MNSKGENKNDPVVNNPVSSNDYSIAALESAPKDISSEAINMIPEEVAKRYRLAAFEKRGKSVKVAMTNPQDINALNALRFIAEREKINVEAYLVSDDILDEILKAYTGASAVIKKAIESFEGDVEFEEKEKEEDAEKKREILKDAPVTKLVQVIVSHAIEGKASDIHIEPMENQFRVRFRVDGVLHISLILPKEIGPAVIARIKILANLKIDEKRKPQDGRFRITEKGKDIDFRVSTFPVLEGEKVVMRILDKESGVVGIEELGILGAAQDNLLSAIKETYGMVLITGPTGSGKSTTLYALLKILNNEERNIVTLEDPIEYYIEGLNQSQIKPEIGYTFASGLRSILRQDPNVIMVGEIRDGETAELAVHSALTGHLMFSTLHTNTAIGAIPRLIDMGIEPFLLSSSLRMVLAQRLVRRICPNCKEEKKVPDSVNRAVLEELKKIPEEELKKYGINMAEGVKYYQGRGCEHCGNTGLKGRVAVYEVVPVTDKMKDIIVEKKGNEDLLIAERDSMGLLTMKQDGILKIVKGMTTIEEIERVTEGNISLEEGND